MQTVSLVRKMRTFVCDYNKKAKSIGFVPTMGCLHEGHLSLVRRAKKENDIVIVSIYVNPLQFGQKEDFEKYPRDINHDLLLLEKEKVDVVFIPSDREMNQISNIKYQISKIKKIKFKINQYKLVPPEYLTNCLCDKSRPGHFEGVATIVAKLFNIIQATRAYFGQKDYQQCLIVKKLVDDFCFPIKVAICPTIREKDGLAMSSRNTYLNAEERKIAPVLFETLRWMENQIQNSKCKMQNDNSKFKINKLKDTALDQLQRDRLIRVDYFEIRDAEDLSEVVEIEAGQKVLIAGAIRIGRTRLIDNIITVTQKTF